jgi:hypothetical protein
MSFINTRSVTEGEESPIRGNVDSALHQTEIVEQLAALRTTVSSAA